MKKFLSMILSILLLFSFCGCSFKFEEPKLKQYEDFWYCYVTNANSNRPALNGDYIAIVQLTEEAKQKDRIIIPETIEGKPVVLVGMVGFMGSYNIGEGAKYTKLYFPSILQKRRGKWKDEVKVFFIEEPIEMDLATMKNFFTTEEIYEKYNGKEEDCEIEVANIQYVLDDEIYFIDDYRESKGNFILEPPTPKKEGFIFDGWYLEKEYISKWDFENDLHIYDESQKVTFLYGKWNAI